MAEKEIGVISPVGLEGRERKNISQPIDTLHGKTVCEVFNNHFKGKQMFEIYRQLLDKRFTGVKVIPYTQFPIIYVGGDAASQRTAAEKIATLAKEKGCDALISGNGG